MIDKIIKVRDNSTTAMFEVDPNAGCDPLDVSILPIDLSNPDVINKGYYTDIINKKSD